MIIMPQNQPAHRCSSQAMQTSDTPHGLVRSANAAREYLLITPPGTFRGCTGKSSGGLAWSSWAGRSLLAGLVRAVPVVMAGVLAGDGPLVPFTVDENPVGALGSCAAYPPLGMALRARRPRRDCPAGAGRVAAGWRGAFRPALPGWVCWSPLRDGAHGAAGEPGWPDTEGLVQPAPVVLPRHGGGQFGHLGG